MARFVSPPKNELDKLRQPLEPGERLVFEFFDRFLDENWEIYIQPHLNGLRPDFVLLNPGVGIAVFEIKDWELDAMNYFFKCQPGKPPKLMAKKDGKEFSKQHENPVEQVYRYKQEIYDLYCPRLKRQSGLALITAGVIFPCADDNRVEILFHPSREFRDMLGFKEKYYPISGMNSLQIGNLSKIFPEAKRRSYYMNSDMAKDLRNWLVEPDFSATQRTPLEIDEKQREYIITRTKSGYRRIRGPAGSGKSLVLAARAAQLASEGKDVLVVTFNITLLHYLKDLSVRWKTKGNTKRDITWLNYHLWCKRVCQESGLEGEYKAIWRRHHIDEDEMPTTGREITSSLDEISKLVSSIPDIDNEDIITKYDAILVDEGQDYLPEWWNVLRKVCKKNGEMLLVADATQDIYEKAKSWTDQAMIGAGFEGGPWAKLEVSYRMPPQLIGLVRTFAKQFLPIEFANLPYSPQQELKDTYPCKLRWVQTSKEKAVQICEQEILSLAPSADPSLLSMADITFLASTNKLGHTVVDGIGIKGINFVHTFSDNSSEARRRKLGFYMGDARLKATTLHSFKGWESKSLVVYIGHLKDIRAMYLAYTGMTRLKRNADGSFLTIICAIKELEEYGRTWPEFEYK